MGLDWDEGPFYQSERLDIYREYANKLVSAGRAEKLNDGTEAIIFNFADEGSTVLYDLVHGKIEFENKGINDQVLIKSDGYPAYNFACVVDDALMNITHVLRGDDHISNTPKQIAVFHALGLTPPKYAHIPLIMGKDNTRLSKRHGATSVTQYRDLGFLPEAFNNFLALLGWSAGDNKEIMSTKELIEKFSIKRITGKSAIFDSEKFEWLNGQYLKQIEPKKFYLMVFDLLKKNNLIDDSVSQEWLLGLSSLFQKRIRKLNDFISEADYFFKDDIEYQEEIKEKYLKNKSLIKIVKGYKNRLEKTDDFSIKNLENIARDYMEKEYPGAGGGDLIHPLRAALTGRENSPGIFEVMHFLGKNRVLKRIS